MYNRYIPQDTSFAPVEPPPIPGPPPSRPPQQSRPFRLPELGGLFSKGETGLSNLLGSLHLDNLDSGDILLLLILLYLLVEGEDLDLVIALGLVLLMGSGDEE